jgi:serine/threonine protein kinase
VRRFGPQKAAVVADIGAGAARALEHAHANNVIHRDIKPANLMLPNNGGVKVADFGLARALSSESGLTMTGAIMGTPDYMAPEQAQGESVGPLADVYSLGATLYHLFVGRPPFQGASPMAVALQHVTNRVVVPEELVTDETSRQLTRVIHELTQKDPAKRPAKLEEVMRRLQQIARGARPTQKLLSEGATLFETAGVTLNAEAINKAKEEAAATALDKGRVQSPHLDKLRGAAEKARSGMHAAIPERPVAPPPPKQAEMPELTGDMVREARAKARRSSGQVKSLPPDMERQVRRTSNPAMSPHRETRPSSGTSRRSRPVQQNDEDENSWESYAAKSFPTFERSSIVSGAVGDEIVRERESGIREGSRVGSGVDFSKPSGSVAVDEWRPPPPKRRSSGGIGSLLIAVLIIAGVAGGIWWFFLRDPAQHRPQGDGPLPGSMTATKFTAHGRGVGVTAISHHAGGAGFYTGGEDGTIHRWVQGKNEPEASAKVPHGAITALAARPEVGQLVVGTAGGIVLLLDASSLQITRGLEVRVEGRVTALLPISHTDLIVGDSLGRLTSKGSAGKVQLDSAPISGLVMRNNEIWAAAGKRMAAYQLTADKDLQEMWMFPNMPDVVHSMTVVPDGVFGVVGSAVRRLTPQGAAAESFDVRFKVIGRTYDSQRLVVIGETGAVLLNPATLAPLATAALDSGDTVISIGTSTQPGNAYLGTRSGDVYQCVYH